MSDQVTRTFVLPWSLLKALYAEAKAKRRSGTQQLIVILRERYEQAEPPPDAPAPPRPAAPGDDTMEF